MRHTVMHCSCTHGAESRQQRSPWRAQGACSSRADGQQSAGPAEPPRDRSLHKSAIETDKELDRFCRERLPHQLRARYDGCFGTGPEASPWQHGAPPLWLLEAFMTHLVDSDVAWHMVRHFALVQQSTDATWLGMY